MKHINIPEPCSEDWDKMTPNEKGAFCQKCAHDVYDFSGKSADEIRSVLKQNLANPVCMRIQPKQLDELNADFEAWKIHNSRSYQRAWIFTLLVVFGMTLFSCEEDEEPVVKEYQRMAQMILSEDQQEKEEVIDAKEITTSPIESAKKSTNPEVKQVVLPDDEMILGKPIIPIEKEFECEMEEVVVSEKVSKDSKRVRTAIYGDPIISVDYVDYLTHDVDSDPDVIESVEISALVYPNPASTETTLSINLPSSGKTHIYMVNSAGEKVRSIHEGRMKKGTSEFQLDIKDLEPGIYFIYIQSNELKETVRLSKI